ncbi:MAG: beta-N-acetylglucosaminidase domain-containing protein, partial [Deltaproteobacteria bacterium]|nr:beta-N-acetylglucosaminidase domain-containing protein [Deltaproteobacteria bacterium]
MSKPRPISTLGAAQAALLVLAACSSPPAPSVVPDAAPELTDAAPPPHATPVELGRRVRLGATDPVLRPLLPWPREAEDAVAAARDDRGETAWRAPAGPSWLELDLVPWLGTPVPLETLILAFEAADPVPGASVTLSDACGLAGEVRAWPLPEVALDLSGATAGCLRIDFDAAAPFSLASFSLTSRDGRVPATEPAAGAAPWGQDRGEHRRLSGVVEGFYGVPWSWRERRAMVRHLGGLGLGTYIYAPKNDPLHRAEWRTPYPEEEQEAFASLASLGREAGVSICFGISPFVDWGPDPEADYSLLLDKLRSFADLGVQGVALLADDIEFEASVTVDGALGAAHAAIANHLLEDLRADHPDLALWFVPTVYSDDRLDQWEGGGPYLEALRELHPDVPVMWTGTDTFSPTLAAADLDRVRGLIGRRPVIWDNYWANDGGDMFTGRILLAPLDGRAPDLLEGAAGVVTNPMIQGALSRLAVTTLAAWLDDPASYQPKDAARTAAQVEGPEPLLREVMAWFHGATNKSPRFDALEAGVAAVLG